MSNPPSSRTTGTADNRILDNLSAMADPDASYHNDDSTVPWDDEFADDDTVLTRETAQTTGHVSISSKLNTDARHLREHALALLLNEEKTKAQKRQSTASDDKERSNRLSSEDERIRSQAKDIIKEARRQHKSVKEDKKKEVRKEKESNDPTKLVPRNKALTNRQDGKVTNGKPRDPPSETLAAGRTTSEPPVFKSKEVQEDPPTSSTITETVVKPTFERIKRESISKRKSRNTSQYDGSSSGKRVETQTTPVPATKLPVQANSEPTTSARDSTRASQISSANKLSPSGERPAYLNKHATAVDEKVSAPSVNKEVESFERKQGNNKAKPALEVKQAAAPISPPQSQKEENHFQDDMPKVTEEVIGKEPVSIWGRYPKWMWLLAGLILVIILVVVVVIVTGDSSGSNTDTISANNGETEDMGLDDDNLGITVPPIPLLEQNEQLLCISVVARVAGYERPVSNTQWTDFRQEYPNRSVCILQPVEAEGESFLDIPSDFSQDDSDYTFQQTKRDYGNPEDAQDWYSNCGLGSIRSRGINHVAFFLDTSSSFDASSSVAASFRKFQDRLTTSGFHVVRGDFNTRQDWLTPCRTAQVMIESSIEQGCDTNEQCESHICVEKTCRDTYQGPGEACDPNDPFDCRGMACGAQAFEQGSPTICCPSHETIFTFGFGLAQNFCTGQPPGAPCGDNNELCDSLVCLEDSGVCQ